MLKHSLLDDAAVEALCRLAKFSLSSFEPQDAARMARLLVGRENSRDNKSCVCKQRRRRDVFCPRIFALSSEDVKAPRARRNSTALSGFSAKQLNSQFEFAVLPPRPQRLCGKPGGEQSSGQTEGRRPEARLTVKAYLSLLSSPLLRGRTKSFSFACMRFSQRTKRTSLLRGARLCGARRGEPRVGEESQSLAAPK